MGGHYVLNKNKSAWNVRYCCDIALRWMPQALGRSWTSNMRDAMRHFFKVWSETTNAHFATLDQNYKRFTGEEMSAISRCIDILARDLDRQGLDLLNL